MIYKKIIFSTLLFFIFFNFSFAQELVQWRGSERNGVYDEKDLLKEWPA